MRGELECGAPEARTEAGGGGTADEGFCGGEGACGEPGPTSVGMFRMGLGSGGGPWDAVGGVGGTEGGRTAGAASAAAGLAAGLRASCWTLSDWAMCAGTNGVVGVGMTPNWRPRRGAAPAWAPALSTLGTRITGPCETCFSPSASVVTMSVVDVSTAAVSSSVLGTCGGKGGAFLWLTGQGSHARLHMTMISRSGPRSRASAKEASAEGTTRSPPSSGKTRPEPSGPG